MRASLSLRRAFVSWSSRLVPWSTTVRPADPADDCSERRNVKVKPKVLDVEFTDKSAAVIFDINTKTF